MNLEKLDINSFNQVYLVGIGGIGMSALARYFLMKGADVGGYDKTASKITESLELEGAKIHYKDLGAGLPLEFTDPESTLVVYTPAISEKMGELRFFYNNGFTVLKRSEVLGLITCGSKALCVAGTHGKTTTSALLAHVLNESYMKCNAFLGGISTNFNSNFIGDSDSDLTVVEADEFDRSFLKLTPFSSIVTTTDSDHLDIYNDEATFLQGFQNYVDLIDKNGVLVHHVNVNLDHVNSISYGMNSVADYSGSNERFIQGTYQIDVKTPNGIWERVVLGLPGTHNADNAIACIALLQSLGLEENVIREGLASFKGVKRRFEYHVQSKNLVYIDDYAHHPTEIKALIDAVKMLYPGRKIKAIFQPHLFTRTRDFFNEFVEQLSRFDELLLMPIYPAREEPIEGVTSDSLLAQVRINEKSIVTATEAVNSCRSDWSGVVLTIGAGDVDRIVEPLKSKLS